MKLGVALGRHSHSWEETLGLVRLAEELGFDSAWVDGDVSMLDVRRDPEVLDGWTVTTALLAHTQRICVGSIRLVHHWNAARLAQAVATAERLFPRRLRFLISVGDRPIDARFGLPNPAVAERIAWLDECLAATRALWRGESVTADGLHVQLDGARISPAPPPGRPRIEIAAARPRMLRVVAAHADLWEVNLPPLRDRVGRAAERLEDACRERGRDPAEIDRSLWIFTRVDPSGSREALAEFRRLNPWFGAIGDAEIAPALVLGDATACRERLADLARDLSLDRPVVDLCGLDAPRARQTMRALAGKP